MKNKSKKGFTLIELLAVIVILAVIALIATPIILGIIENTKKDSFERSVELVLSTTDLDVSNKNIQEGYKYEIVDGTIPNLGVGIKNTQGLNGEIYYDETGNSVYAIHNGVYCVKKTEDMEKAQISDYIEGECTLSNSTSEKCFAFSNNEITDYYTNEDNDTTKPECPKDVIIPDTINGEEVTAIENNAFKEKGLTSVKLPNGVISIGESAFSNNKLSGELDLSSLTSLTSIGESAFSGSSTTNRITGLKLPSSVISIGESAFQYNKLSGELDLSHLTSLTYVSGFGGNELTSIKLPENVAEIGSSAFAMTSLGGELDLKDLVKLEVIGIGSFAYTNAITSIKLPASIKTIERHAFKPLTGANKLKEVVFYDRSDLTGITINSYAFEDGYDAWVSGCSITTCSKFVETPKIPNDACFAFSNNTITNYYSYENNVSSNPSCTKAVIIPDAINGEEVTAIGDNAFNNKGLTDIKIPASVTSIGSSAFASNSLSGNLDLKDLIELEIIGASSFYYNTIISLKLPDSVTSIGDNAFKKNKISVELDLSNTSLTNIGSSAFEDNQIASIKLPNSVESIGDSAFYMNELSGELDLKDLVKLEVINSNSFGYSKGVTSIKLPASVTNIKSKAFEANSPKNTLTSLIVYGRSDLTGITIASDAFSNAWTTGCDLTKCVEFVNEE